MPKTWVGRTTLNGEKKKDDGLMKYIALPWLILIYKIEKGIN